MSEICISCGDVFDSRQDGNFSRFCSIYRTCTDIRKDFSKNPDVIVHASSTSRLFEMMNSKITSTERKIGLRISSNGGCRSLNDIMTELNNSIASLDSAGQSEDNSSMLEGSSYTTGGSMTESMADLATEDMITALRAQRAALLQRRADVQIRLIHLENDESAILSGQRIQHVAGHEWSRKHVTTGFSISSPTEGIQNMDDVSQLEFDVEIQQKIVNAARRLAREHGIRRNVKRERKMAAQRAMLKLQDLERKLQSARRFQRPPKQQHPAAVTVDGNDSTVKLREHQSYYKAVADNGYYPYFRSSRTTSSTSDDKGSSNSEHVESDGVSLPSSYNSQDSVRACLQMSLHTDTKTLPRKRLDNRPRHSTSVGSTSPLAERPRHSTATSISPRSVSPSVFTPSAVRIENLNISANEKSRGMANGYNAIAENIHSYDRYLQTLRQNRQRNGPCPDYNRNTENRRHSMEVYRASEGISPCGHQDLNMSAVSVHSTVV